MGKEKIMAKVIEIAEKRDALELSKDEIALALVDDLESSAKKLATGKDYLSGAYKALKKADAAILKIQDIVDEAEGLQANTRTEKAALKEAGDSMLKIEKQAKELGIAPSSIPAYKKVDKLWDDVNDLIDQVDDYELPKI